MSATSTSNRLLCDRCSAEVLSTCAGVGLGTLALSPICAAVTPGITLLVCATQWNFRDRSRCRRCGREQDTPPPPPPEPVWRSAWRQPRDVRVIQEEFKAAREFTQRVLAQRPTGADDPNILPHVIASLAQGRLVTFSRDDGDDAQKGTALHLLHSLGEDLPEEGGEWDLTLSSPPSWCGTVTSVAELQASTSFVKGATSRIAESLGVAPNRVHITGITEGSVHLKYTVADLTCKEKERILSSDVTGQLRSQFDTFVKLNVSPAVLALHFNLNDLDPLGHKSSDQFSSTFQVGPPGKTRTYHQPSGWNRYGFKVLGKYGEDTWLSPFQHGGNWYRAFHGPGRSGADNTVAKKIFDGGFKASSVGKLGPGVYTSPLVQYVETNYCPVLKLELGSGTKQFKFVLQVAVRPGGIMKEGYPNATGTNQEWTALAQDVRPYGLLIKEV